MKKNYQSPICTTLAVAETDLIRTSVGMKEVGDGNAFDIGEIFKL